MSETKFTPLEATESERLARVKKPKPRNIGEALRNAGRAMEKEKRLVEKNAKFVQRAKEAAERRRKREIKAVEVNADRLTTALARAEERAKAAKEPKADDFESYEVSGGEEAEVEKKVTNKHVIRRGDKAAKDHAKDLAGLGEESQGEVEEISDEDIVGVEEEVDPSQIDEFIIPVEGNQNKELSPVSGEIDAEVSRNKLLFEAARRSAAKEVPFVSPDNIEESKRLAEEEDTAYKKANQKFAPKKEKEEKPPKTFEELKQFIANSPSVVEATSKLVDRQVEKQVELVQKEREEIIEFFKQKHKDIKNWKNADDLLMGPEIKGWFKGKERKLQARYKELDKKFWELLRTGISPISPVVRRK